MCGGDVIFLVVCHGDVILLVLCGADGNLLAMCGADVIHLPVKCTKHKQCKSIYNSDSHENCANWHQMCTSVR